jgi:CRP/FNR family cyclic AMP-dependent transcriptional regulator
MQTMTLEAHEVFSYLRPDQLGAVSEAAEPVSRRAGETVYRQGERADFLYVVLTGRVALSLPGRGDVSVLVDHLGAGEMFGSCVCLDLAEYSVTAQCVEDSELLRIEASVLKRLMDQDLKMGYALQTRISKIYFGRYVDAMRKLQAIVMNLPLEAR